MHVITRKRLNDFAARYPETGSALTHWYQLMKRTDFASFAELRAIFPAADQVGKLTVFNVDGNSAEIRLGSLRRFITIIVEYTSERCLHIESTIKIGGRNKPCRIENSIKN